MWKLCDESTKMINMHEKTSVDKACLKKWSTIIMSEIGSHKKSWMIVTKKSDDKEAHTSDKNQ